MTAYSTELIIFDLEGTLAPSKTALDHEMADLLVRLLARKKVAVISGNGYPQFETQLIKSLPVTAECYSNLFLFPASGTRLYIWKGSWCEQYAEHLTPPEKERIMTSLNTALKTAGYVKPAKTFGPIIEDRGSQITFSALGQNAPLEAKRAWDPRREKRQAIADILRSKIPECDVRIGGTTSIDITRRGVNKGFAIRKLEQRLGLPLDHMTFIGDSLFQGGNDYPAKAMGIECVSVGGPQETKKLIASWLS